MNPPQASSSDGSALVMGTPSSQSNPYVVQCPPPPPPPPSSANNNMDHVRKKFNSWGNKAETAAANIWTNLKAGQSVTGSAWGKVNLTAKALTEGGLEALYKHNFSTYPQEKLKRTFACHLSTSTGPVGGTLYLSNVHVAFCSDRPLSSIQPNGMESWIHYKLIIPLEKIARVSPLTVPGQKQQQLHKYIHLSTIDAQDFWFMGFVNHDKASKHLLNACFNSIHFIPSA